jgi:hypothetical protein
MMKYNCSMMKRKFLSHSPIQLPKEIPFAPNEHVWVRSAWSGRVREFIMASQTSYLDELGTELMLNVKECIRSSPFAKFVRVSEVVHKPCRVWVLDSESHVYVCGALSESNVFRSSVSEYELDASERVSLSPVHHSGYESGHMWSIQSNRLMIVHVRDRVIVYSRPLWEMSSIDFVRTFLGEDSECESTLIALLEMNGFAFV